MDPPRSHPLIVAAAAGVLIFSILGIAVVKDVRQTAASRRDEAVVRPKVAPGACGDCGVLQAMRPVNTGDAQHYLATVKMDDGTVRTLSLAEMPAHAVGEQVRLLNGALSGRR